ncbi:DUF4396 domain-containing protein [Methyloceanibacter sp. wino2]|uniref:DUF4396 domain-containing protein n=1 Tax=Methyloceanibacter sp. wino2 TaxID=2170729 RepID=UPI001ABBB294|nr:DUF4396 domain-containing protein [Methyloceanibacter sp. wino2]
MLIDGVVLLWFILTALSLIFVAVDIRSTPENPVMKWAFVLFTAYSGPFGAFLYVLGCREPLPGLHERYVTARWRQALGSTMHCAAGDGVGILVGAVIGALVALPLMVDFALEYVLGFAFGWTIFQALFMGEMFGTYWKALKGTFTSEFLSMNCLMGGMLPVSALAFQGNPNAHDPTQALFWFRMSLALMVGALAAYPMNYWLVAHHLKHGMLTVRPAGSSAGSGGMEGMDMPKDAGTDSKMASMSMADKMKAAESGSALHKPSPPVWVMGAVSLAVLALGIVITLIFA